jgi:glyceraldehyde-3-phosphate dehydrogenase (NAD(P))
MIKVSVNGYGTIGRRVAEAVIDQKDMDLYGVTKRTVDRYAKNAMRRGLRIALLGNDASYLDVLTNCDLVVDCTDGGIGERNKKNIYSKKKDLHVIFQGGERPDVADVSFNSSLNYREALGKRYIRVVSCNTTAISRVWSTVRQLGEVKNLSVYILRRSTDPHFPERGLINDIILSPRSHHSEDVITIDPRLSGMITTSAVNIPVTRMHTQNYTAEFRSKPSKDKFLDLCYSNPRIAVLNTTPTHNQIFDSIRKDICHLMLLADTLEDTNGGIRFTAYVHQEYIVVPENIDAIRASLEISESPEESTDLTDRFLDIQDMKKELEYIFG